MKTNMLFAGAVVVVLACPLAAQAQGIPGGIAHGASVGNQAAGPVGAVVGGAVGGVVGGVEGLFGIQPVPAAYSVAAPAIQPASVVYPEPALPAYRHHRHYRRHTYRRMPHHRVS